jgi:hypothetical protein
VNRATALLIARYEANLCAEDIGLDTTPEQNELVQKAVETAWNSLSPFDQKSLRKYGYGPEAEG